MLRYLGQHFLKNKKKLQKIVEALELKNGDTVVEIGPGHGELTSEIIKKFQILKVLKFKIVAIEKDKRLVLFLKEKFAAEKNVEIIEGDALKEIKNQISKIKITNQKSKIVENFKIVGNIPYYITGYLFRILGELDIKSLLIVLLIQKEVAERISAKTGKMNLLAASVQFWAEPKIIGYVSKKDFKPMPKVDSAIIKLMTYDKGLMTNEAEKYYKFIKILFKQPRKTILNNVSKFKGLKAPKEEVSGKLKEVGVNPQARPQDLSIEEIIKLSTFITHIH